MVELLKESKIFNECTNQELTDISNICQTISVKDGEQILEAKSPAEYLYIIAEGCVELRFTVTHYFSSQKITFDRKVKGEAFGWSALAEPHLYTLAAWAVKDSKLLKLTGNDIKRLCSENYHLGYVLMKNVAEIIGERFDLVQKILIDTIQLNLKEKEL
ncbi:MAG: cyclic nucleotide-binding domain-containing protein [Calditrichia bacterium]|nr:cyclic nucleotide-binding domain-containing protein [Calditrichia bacterium]